jgi:hypothetical protein
MDLHGDLDAAQQFLFVQFTSGQPRSEALAAFQSWKSLSEISKLL